MKTPRWLGVVAIGGEGLKIVVLMGLCLCLCQFNHLSVKANSVKMQEIAQKTKKEALSQFKEEVEAQVEQSDVKKIKDLDEQIQRLEEEVTIYQVKDWGYVQKKRGSDPGITNGLKDEVIDYVGHLPVTLFGDSLIAGSHPTFRRLFPYENHLGVGSMQIGPEGLSRYQTLINNQQVQGVVIVNLGTNRGLSQGELDTFMALSGDRHVFFINTISQVGHQASVDQELRLTVQKYPNAHLVDFRGHFDPSYLDTDAIHHSQVGKEAMVKLTADTIFHTYYTK